MSDRRWRRASPAVRVFINEHLVDARSGTDPWPTLERAHIASQPWVWSHTRVHAAMLRVALRQRDRREILGQLVRLAVAAPGTLTSRFPAGNSGRSTMPLTATADVPTDIARLLHT